MSFKWYNSTPGPYKTRAEWEAHGFQTLGTLQGPLDLDFARNYAADLRESTRDDGRPVFGPIIIVAQDNDFNVIEIVKAPTTKDYNACYNIEKRDEQRRPPRRFWMITINTPDGAKQWIQTHKTHATAIVIGRQMAARAYPGSQVTSARLLSGIEKAAIDQGHEIRGKTNRQLAQLIDRSDLT